ncbi:MULTISPECIES: HAD family hydrolase [unclassified Chelatococcus]|uniref:HAD-IIA family hydrolase n=1 Tax=unclassified Chelatococcus TaxID=2638111 RepID=UPI001BCC86FB|nr:MULTISPECIES: HAD family hydrolase [unclassified Chelatococcus]MBS7697013.1 HAD hydrolase-like protein [Chelatococcus sp. YT9]MBX3556003.1 HAD hydrolase-like protein [Chelatococcus sp.]
MRALEDISGCLVDLDGTLVSGGLPLPGAADFLDAFANRCVIVSNDAEHTPVELARSLRRLRLNVPAERILLAGASALDGVAAERPGARVLMLASRSLMRYARGRGLAPVAERPDFVFLGRDRQFTYERLAIAANAVRSGAKLVVANPDLVHPGVGGRVVPETGALLAALLACTGPVPYRLVGKPQPALFEAGLALLDLPRHLVAMVGDNPATDGEGARRAGLRYVEMTGGFFPDAAREGVWLQAEDGLAIPAGVP